MAMLKGLIAAVHTPFNLEGKLNLAVVHQQAAWLKTKGINYAFVGGSTGEFASMSISERYELTDAWSEAARNVGIQFIVHVGSNCLRDAQTGAELAASRGAVAVAALSPCYFKPSLETLVDWCEEIAGHAPGIPFYYYDIPGMTGSYHSMPRLLSMVNDRIPNFSGIKFTSPDIMSYQKCLHTSHRRFNMLWGIDESLLSGLAVGAPGAVGSSYNFAAPIYLKLMSAFEAGNLEEAQECQLKSVKMISLLSSYGYMGAAKATMKILGIDVGQPRLPNSSLSDAQIVELEKELKALGFFEWIA